MIRGGTITRIFWIVGLLGVAGVAALVALKPLDRSPIAARGGRELYLEEIETPHYMQTDARWGSDRLGSTVESLAASGCTVCCLSMALARYGVEIGPGELNRRLAHTDGFTEHGWLKWTSVERLSKGRLVADVPTRPDHDRLDEAIENRWPVLTKIRLRGEIPHWVLIVGKRGADYIARDPLVPGRPVAVAERSALIETIRIVRPR